MHHIRLQGSKMTHPARCWNAEAICTNCVYTIPSPEMGSDSVLGASQPSPPATWLALLLTRAGEVKSNTGLTTHTNTQLQVTDLLTAPVEMGNLLVEWRRHQSTSGFRLDGGIPSVCVETVVGPLHPFFGRGVRADNNNNIRLQPLN